MHKHSDATPGTSRMTTRPGASLPRRKALPLYLAMALAAGSALAPAAHASSVVPGGINTGTVSVGALTSPTGGTVVGGIGSISQDGSTTVINQISNKLALDWLTFNVGKDATVLFKQPSFTAVALNRILDQNPSQIFGRINSNGQVFLINTHGIIFGSTAQVNVGGLVASTLDLTPTDFLASHFNLDAHGGMAGVVNHGTIAAASGGSVSLLGGSVANDGLILANYGNINLDGADKAVLDFDGNGLINIQVTGELKQRLDANAAVSNSGTLQADGGTVVLQASAAKDLFTDVVNNAGVITAGGISTDGGTVRLVASGGNTISSGSIDVSGVHGGSAQVLSDANVGVTGKIDASGTQGGGSIRVGGGWQGGEGLTTANVTYLGPDAVLDADATQSGHGGSVVLWGNQGNNFYGSISARGGASGGDGGRVETSSHYGLNVQGRVDASASAGTAGNWLIDPYNVTIQSGAGTLTSPFTATADSNIQVSALNNALTGTNVTVFTGSSGTSNGDITVNASIQPTAGDNSLYLEAAGGIYVNSNITANASHTLNLYLWSNYGGAAAGTSYVSNAACAVGVSCVVAVGDTGNAAIATNGGLVDIRTGTGGGAFTLGNGSKTGSINTAGGALTVQATGISQLAGSNTIAAGAATLDAGAGAISLGNAGNNFSGTVSLANSGANNVTLSNGTHALDLGASTVGSGTLSVSATGISQSGAIVQAASAGAASFNAGAGDISLGNTGNNFTGTVSLANSGANNVVLDNGTHALDLGASTVGSGTLSVSATGITQSGAIVQAASAGAASFNAGAGAISLGNTGNNFTGTVSLANSGANNVVLDNGTHALDLGASTVGSGTLSVSATGISQSGAIVQAASAGAASFNAGAGAIALGNAGNNFTGTVSLANSGANNVVLDNGTHALDLGASTVGSGTLSVSATGITQSGAIVQAAGAGAVALDAGAAALVLGGSNDFSGAVTASGTAITLNDTTGLDLAGLTSAANNAVTVSAGGPLTLGAGITTINTGTADLSLSSGGALAIGATLAGTNIALTGTTGLTLGNDVTATGTLNLTSSSGGIAQTAGILTVGGTTDVQAGSGSITLGQLNVFSGAVSLGTTGAGNASIVNGSGVLTLGTVAVGGDLDVASSGGIGLATDITTGGAQTYHDAVTLGADLTLASSGAGAIGFGSTVDGAHALSVNTAGTTGFGGAVGGTTALTSLTT
ncbi:filamentous hemagglutinin N-terminal domain-containing protein, partial [Dyella ginsengisoli]